MFYLLLFSLLPCEGKGGSLGQLTGNPEFAISKCLTLQARAAEIFSPLVCDSSIPSTCLS
jgi:hypothetical protein